MADTIARLAGPALLSNTTAAIVTAPSSTTYTIRTITLGNTTGTERRVTIAIGTGATTANRILPTVIVPGDDVLILNFDALVISNTETLHAYADATDVITYAVFGVSTV